MKRKAQRSRALFDLEPEAPPAVGLPLAPKPKAKPRVRQCPGERCKSARATYPDTSECCVLCKAGRPKEPICGRCIVLIEKVEAFFEQAERRMERESA